MKRHLILLLIIPVILFSCQKEKDASIVGEWEQIARYSENGPGQYAWNYTSDAYPLQVVFTADGRYSEAYREPLGGGKYKYDYATKQLKFEEEPSGTINISAVSYLDADYLVIDIVHNGILYTKNKYKRK